MKTLPYQLFGNANIWFLKEGKETGRERSGIY
jgi:hypothetical protein